MIRLGAPAVDDAYLQYVDRARQDIRHVAQQQHCAPSFLRLAVHDSLTFDKATRTGGPNGSIRVSRELEHPGNEGLAHAVALLEAIKAKFSVLSYADLYQLAGVVAVELLGGPLIPYNPGRSTSQICPPRGRLPSYDKSQESPGHLQRVFRRTGLSKRHMVALVGAHPFGASWQNAAAAEERHKDNPISFDNSYYRDLLEGSSSSPCDPAFLDDTEVKVLAEGYRDNAVTWLEDYAAAAQALAELGTSVGSSGGSSSSKASKGFLVPRDDEDVYTTTQVALGAAAVVAVGALAWGAWYWNRRRRIRRLLQM